MSRVKSWMSGLLASVSISACASVNSVTVLQRADHLSSTPEWASITRSVVSDKESTSFLGYVELDSDASKSAALNMADQKAYAAPMEAVVEAYFQQNKVAEELRKNSSVSELLLSAARSERATLPGLTVKKRYWEIVEVRSSSGTEQQLHVYSLAEVPTPEFEKAKKDLVAKLNGKSELKRQLDDIAKKQQDQLLNEK